MDSLSGGRFGDQALVAVVTEDGEGVVNVYDPEGVVDTVSGGKAGDESLVAVVAEDGAGVVDNDDPEDVVLFIHYLIVAFEGFYGFYDNLV